MIKIKFPLNGVVFKLDSIEEFKDSYKFYSCSSITLRRLSSYVSKDYIIKETSNGFMLECKRPDPFIKYTAQVF